MTHLTRLKNLRILIVDDNPAIHEDFRRVLLRDDSHLSDLDGDAAALFGGAPDQAQDAARMPFEVDSAFQGEEALELVQEASAKGRPYALAFVDMRMPPGWDGLTTIQKLWEVDNSLQVVICTAFSDRSWMEIQRTLTARDMWLVVKKPFDQIEVLQLAHALTEKWNISRQNEIAAQNLEIQVEARSQELERLGRVKDQFFSNITHEMLTPLNGISGMLELLATEDLPDEVMENVDVARRCAGSLHQLIQQVLVINDAASGAVAGVREEGSPREWAEQVKARYGEMAERMGVRIDLRCDPALPAQVSCPGGVIMRVLDALMDNAIKFSDPEKGSVTLEVGWRPAPAARSLQFVVIDTGCGMSSEQLQLIRIPFAQVDGATNRKSSGAGLGLTLARRLLTLVGSELQIASRLGEGTRVSFALAANAMALEPLASAV